MADNTELNTGSGGDVISTDDLGSVKVQRVKVQFGGDGSATDVSASDPLPVVGTHAISDVAGATDPGMAALAVRQDTQADLGADGDWVALSVDGGGALRVNAVNAGGTNSVDSAAGGTDSGAVMLAVRDDTLSTLTPAEGDYANLRVDSTGALHVTGVGGGTEYTEDVATASPIVGSAVMMERDDALSTLTPAAGDWASFRCSAEGALWTQDYNSAAILAALSGTLTVDLAGNNDVTVTGTVDLGSVDNAVLDQIASNTTGLAGAVSGSELQVDIVSAPTLTVASHAVTNAGTFATQAAQSGTWNVTNISGTVSLPTGASTAANQATQTTALQLIDNMIVAHDAAITGATGLAAIGLCARSTEPTAVASNDATRPTATLLGKQVVQPFAIPASTWSYASPAAVTDTSDDAAKAAGGGSVRNYITGIQVMNSHATTGTAVVIKDGSTVLWQGYAAPVGGGCSAQFNPPLRGTANTAVNVANVTTSSSTFFNLQGYVASE